MNLYIMILLAIVFGMCGYIISYLNYIEKMLKEIKQDIHKSVDNES